MPSMPGKQHLADAPWSPSTSIVAVDRLAHRRDVEVELVAGPAGLHLRAAGNMLLQLVDVVGDPAPRLVLAEVVGQVDVDGLCHCMRCRPPFSAFQAAPCDYDRTMRASRSCSARSLRCRSARRAPLAPVAAPIARAAAWDPAAAYITAGQDEPGYRSWYLAAPWRAAQVKAFNDYLATYQVGGILPTWQLLRTATSWKDCGGQPFEVPPTDEWPHIVQTLRYIHDYVIPAVGPVEPVSVYRNPALNAVRGRSAGKRAQALFGDRHGAAAADHPRDADADACARPFAAWRAI